MSKEEQRECDNPAAQADQATRDVVKQWVRRGETRIEPSQDGQRLDRYLAARFTYRSRTQWREIVRAGRITVNGLVVRPARPLRAGDLIGYVPLVREEPAIDPGIDLLFLDDDLAGINKTGNLPIHPSGAYFRHTLIHLLAAEHPEWGDLRVIHRLDRETSGIIILGRSRAATETIARQFRAREVSKRYLAIVDGEPPADEFVIDQPLGPAQGSLIRKAVGVRADGIAAHTSVRVLHRGADWALVEARPRTGRLHQIRVHLKSARLPILGDKVYGQSEHFFLKFISDEAFTPQEQALLGMPRQALHAYQLALRHPKTDTALTLTAPLPADMAAVLSARGLDPRPWQKP